jgi:hypothetical protein
MRATLLLAAVACLALAATAPSAAAQPAIPLVCGVVIDHSYPATDPHAYVTCGPYWCIVNLEVGIRCFG